jgi:hypothetical protein
MGERTAEVLQRLRSQSGILGSFSDDQLVEIIAKARGECYLCGDPIDFEKDSIEGDHIDPEGGDRPENICLTHKKCNARKRDMPIGLAKIMFDLIKFSQTYDNLPSFDDALDYFVTGDKRKPITHAHFVEENVDYLKVNFGDSLKTKTPLYRDPASKIEYCFCDVPIKNILNDVDIQPRRIAWQHVWKLLLDFMKHPVHEPSSLRLVIDDQTNTSKLKLCDGQHKALAQILLSRGTIPAKVYISPDVQLIRTLIDTIQNRITKLPLYPSIVMEKLSNIYQVDWQRYVNDTRPPHTETGFVKTFKSYQQSEVKNQLVEAIYSSILYGENKERNHKILKYVEAEKRRAGTEKVLSMNLFKKTILANFVYQKPCDFEVGAEQDLRVKEVNNMRRFLDLFVRTFFEDPVGLPKEINDKTIRLFKSGSIRAWVVTLKSAINNRLAVIDQRDLDKTFLRNVSEEHWNGILAILQRLEQHPIWNDSSPDVESRLNENKLETSIKLFSEYATALDVQYLLACPQQTPQ